MKNKSFVNSVIFVAVSVSTIFLVYQFLNSSYYLPFVSLVQKNLIFYCSVIFLIKVLGIVWPPVPGGIFTISSIPFLGWQLAFLLDLIGSTTGGVIAYWLGQKYGYKFLNKMFGMNVANKVRLIRIKEGKEIEAIFMYKILFGNVILEIIYYGAGVLKINFPKFLIGSILAHIIVGIPSFYLVDNLFSGKNVTITIIGVLIAIIFVIKTKGRYFE